MLERAVPRMAAVIVLGLTATTLGAPDGPVPIHTQTRQANICLLVASHGIVAADPYWGVGVARRGGIGNVTHVLWPQGWSARRDHGRIVVVDSSGSVQVREGQRVVMDAAGSDVLVPCNGVWVDYD